LLELLDLVEKLCLPNGGGGGGRRGAMAGKLPKQTFNTSMNKQFDPSQMNIQNLKSEQKQTFNKNEYM